MKWYTDMRMAVAMIILCGLSCLVLGIFWGKDIGERKAQKTEDRFLSIESRLDSHDRIFPVLVASINGVYDYLGTRGEIGSVQQDTTITNDSFLGQDPIPPPAGLEMLIDRAIYQKIERPGEWEWNPETKKWEKSK